MISTKRALRVVVAIIYLGLALTFGVLSDTMYICALGFAGGYILSDAFPRRRKKT